MGPGLTVGSRPAMPPRLSVVVPFYDVEDYIGPCLESLARQTFADFEVVLVDDGSQDGSARVAKAFCERDARFRLVAQENQGLGPARNTGVRHADGEFLAFVDSDDLVVRNAYELMIRSLDETGSSFVAGDGRRFNSSSGVRESWLHRVPFAKDRLATSVLEFPELALDRMVWNKVYRRSFWDKHGYEFPPIRYEDYPVTLRAHIEAAAVDCLAAPVYYWRERESGESITQQRFEYANLCDRLLSAEMVLDLVDDLAPQLRDGVHRHFIQIDYAALVQAFAAVPDQEQERLLGLCQRFAERLDPLALAGASPYDRLQHQAAAAGDLDGLSRLARYRLDGGLREGPRARRRRTNPGRLEHPYPDVRTAPRELYELSAESMFLRTRVTAIAWDDSALIIRGTAEIRHLRTNLRSDLSLSLVYGDQMTALPVERFRAVDSHGDRGPVGFQVRVPHTVLAGFPPDGEAAHLAVEFRQGRARRSDMLRNLRAGNPQWAPGA
ncbi:MAG TPA: glycosyltransferase, partial [Micromonosporaceae bacterium]|nr:glycosyltransferase [Micromonosporaceae bacterium]